MENQWNPNNFQNFAPEPNMQLLPKPSSEDMKPPSAKRPRPASETSTEDDGEDRESYSLSPPPASDTSNLFNNQGQIAHTPITPLMNPQQQMQQPDFSNFMNPMMQQQWAAQMNPMMQQQWAAQMLQQQQQIPNCYPMQQQHQQQQHLQQNMYNLTNLNNTQTSNSSCEEESANASMLQQQQQQQLLQPQQNLEPNEVTFCMIPARLALLSQNKKIKVTLAEIQRRIAAPECLNASLLSAILRKAKNREGGKVLANDLAKHNISLAAGRRKSAPNTAFTALVEAESLTLAKDFHELSDKHFPFNDIAYEFIKGINSIDEWHSCMVVIYNNVGCGVLTRLMSILSSDRSPIVEMPLNRPIVMHPDSQKNFTHFSLLTHGYGIPAYHSSWNIQQKVFKVLFEAMTNPRQFCTKLGRPIPVSIGAIEPLILMSQQQQQQQQNQALLQHSGYPAQMSQQQQPIPKEHLPGYIQ